MHQINWLGALIAGVLFLCAPTAAPAIVIVDTVNPAEPVLLTNDNDSHSFSHDILTDVLLDGFAKRGWL